MSSTATWPPGAMQSTEAEAGNNSAIPARTIATWLQNRAADFLDSPLIRVYRTEDVKGSARRLQAKGKPPRLSRLTCQDACRGLLRVRPRRTSSTFVRDNQRVGPRSKPGGRAPPFQGQPRPSSWFNRWQNRDLCLWLLPLQMGSNQSADSGCDGQRRRKAPRARLPAWIGQRRSDGNQGKVKPIPVKCVGWFHRAPEELPGMKGSDRRRRTESWNFRVRPLLGTERLDFCWSSRPQVIPDIRDDR
jgi:hypothetical protein